MMSHPNWSRRATVWRETWGQALSWRRHTPLVSIPLLRFWIAQLSFLSVSQYLSIPDLFNLRDCLVGNWRSPASFFIVNFHATSCKLPTPLTDDFDIHAQLSIHFRQLVMNFHRFNTLCVQKPNYCSNFTPGCRAKTEHPSGLSNGLFGSGGTSEHSCVAKSHANSCPATPALWRPYFWDHPCITNM